VVHQWEYRNFKLYIFQVYERQFWGQTSIPSLFAKSGKAPSGAFPDFVVCGGFEEKPSVRAERREAVRDDADAQRRRPAGVKAAGLYQSLSLSAIFLTQER
jgi:hypothetical protein